MGLQCLRRTLAHRRARPSDPGGLAGRGGVLGPEDEPLVVQGVDVHRLAEPVAVELGERLVGGLFDGAGDERIEVQAEGRTFAALSIAALLLAGAPAAHAQTGAPAPAVEALLENLRAAADQGDVEAAASLAKAENLDAAERAELEGVLTGDGVLAEAADPDGSIDVVTEGCGVTGGLQAIGPKDQASTLATTYNVTGRCDQSFLFAGITITKTRLTGYYQTRSGVVVSTQSTHGSVMASYEPGVSISFSNERDYLSGGKGHFSMTVTVTRSLFGWNHSTRSGTQAMTANGSRVESCRWA